MRGSIRESVSLIISIVPPAVYWQRERLREIGRHDAPNPRPNSNRTESASAVPVIVPFRSVMEA